MGAFHWIRCGLVVLATLMALRVEGAPANDNFAGAALLSGSVVVTTGTLAAATLEVSEPPHGGDLASVWYRWIAPRSGRVRVACEARAAVYTGSQLANLIQSSREVPFDHHLRNVSVFDAAVAKVYFIAVSGSPAPAQSFPLRLDYTPVNDDFAASTLLTGISNRVEGSTIGGTWELGEPGQQLTMSGNTVWWSYTATASGQVDFVEGGSSRPPVLWIYQGSSVSNLTLVGGNRVPFTDPPLITCRFSCDVRAGQVYRIVATGVETKFNFDMVLQPPPPNDSFASRLVLEPSARVSFSSTIGASREAGEPGTSSNSVWWSWTPAQPGPVILTTFGSACDTVLSVHLGNTPASLVPVVSNDDGYLWRSNSPAADWTNPDGPTNDVISRVRLNADNGVAYRIRVGVAPTNQPPGEVTLNITRLAIDDITAVDRTPRADRTVQFLVNLRLINLRNTASSRLRLRLVAHPGYSFTRTMNFNCPWDSFTAADVPLGTFVLPGTGTLPALGATQIIVEGICPAPVEMFTEGYGYGVIGILEEEVAPTWIQQDARVILMGEWPTVSGSSGPGGGVITISSALQTGNPVGFLDVKVGPPAALRLGGAWRVSPTNSGELGELLPYTTYTSNNFRLAVRSTNFAIQMRPLTGFSVPTNQSVRLQPGNVVNLDLAYSVDPPRLAFDRRSGLGLSGTPLTSYHIISTTGAVSSLGWSPYTNLNLPASGQLWVPQATGASSNRYFRAWWLSE